MNWGKFFGLTLGIGGWIIVILAMFAPESKLVEYSAISMGIVILIMFLIMRGGKESPYGDDIDGDGEL